MTRSLPAILFSLWCGLWLGCAAPALGAAAPAPPPASAFGMVPAMASVVLSPDGQLIAWIDNRGAKPIIKVLDLANGQYRTRWGRPDDMKLRRLIWADAQTLLIEVSFAQAIDSRLYEWFRFIAIDVNTGNPTLLLHDGARRLVTGSRLLSVRGPQPKKVLMSTWDFSATKYKQETGSHIAGGRKDEGWTRNLFEVDVTTGDGRSVGSGTPFTHEWVVDGKGEALARSEWEAKQQKFTVLHRRGSSWVPVLRLDTGELPDLLGASADASALYMTATLGQPHRAIWRLPLDGSAPQVALASESNDMINPVFDPYSQELLGAWRGGAEPELQWLDARAGARAKALQKTFGGKTAHIIGRSADNSRALVSVATRDTPEVYYLVDYKKGSADTAGEEYPELIDVPLGTVTDVPYAARDGYQIPAFLTLPPGRDAKQLPLVVLPHGGPEARDERTFDWLAQFLATRGYAVLQPQFRGSTGYGDAHRLAGYRQWGGLMQDDVTDGVKALIKQGIADPRRVCIVGASYGGYSALAGATFTPELYACAVSINGVSDLPAMLGYERRAGGDESDSVAYWQDHIGSRTSPAIAAKSPSRTAINVRAPILLLHGVDDTVVPVNQSQLMAQALKEHSKPHKFITLPGEDHWLSSSDSRIRVLEEVETFLAEHLDK